MVHRARESRISNRVKRKKTGVEPTAQQDVDVRETVVDLPPHPGAPDQTTKQTLEAIGGFRPRRRGNRDGYRDRRGRGHHHGQGRRSRRDRRGRADPAQVRPRVQHAHLGGRPQDHRQGHHGRLLRLLHRHDAVQHGFTRDQAHTLPRMHRHHRLSGISRQQEEGPHQLHSLVRHPAHDHRSRLLLLLRVQRVAHHQAGHAH